MDKIYLLIASVVIILFSIISYGIINSKKASNEHALEMAKLGYIECIERHGIGIQKAWKKECEK